MEEVLPKNRFRAESAWGAPGPVQSSLEGDGTEEAEGVNAAGVAEGSGGGGGGGTRSGSAGLHYGLPVITACNYSPVITL